MKFYSLLFLILTLLSTQTFAAKVINLNGLWAGHATYFDSFAGNSKREETCGLRFRFKQTADHLQILNGHYNCTTGKKQKFAKFDLKLKGKKVYLGKQPVGTLDSKKLHLVLVDGTEQVELTLITNDHYFTYIEHRVFAGSARNVFVNGIIRRQAFAPDDVDPDFDSGTDLAPELETQD